MPRGIQKTKPGAVDDNATKRALDRKKEMERQLRDASPEPMNPVDAAAEELQYTEPESVRHIFED